mmetsp:Transcript_142550/g.443313  ORF Transcript_142550/g.443313 Transcript_142550/m.443313 type:complete len:213 (+) Transcript_142550:1507-2145(+)
MSPRRTMGHGSVLHSIKRRLAGESSEGHWPPWRGPTSTARVSLAWPPPHIWSQPAGSGAQSAKTQSTGQGKVLHSASSTSPSVWLHSPPPNLANLCMMYIRRWSPPPHDAEQSEKSEKLPVQFNGKPTSHCSAAKPSTRTRLRPSAAHLLTCSANMSGLVTVALRALRSECHARISHACESQCGAMTMFATSWTRPTPASECKSRAAQLYQT